MNVQGSRGRSDRAQGLFKVRFETERLQTVADRHTNRQEKSLLAL